MAVNLNFNDVVSNAAQLYITGVANGTIGLPTLVAAGSVLVSNGTSSPPVWSASPEFRSGTNPQFLRVYNTFTDSSNYERAVIEWAAGVLNIGTNRAGTGVARPVQFQMGGTSVFNISTSGHLNWNTDNTYDIGSLSANRPRNIFAGASVTAGQNVNVGGTSGLYWASRSSMFAPADGVITLGNNASTGFNRLQFGGVTNSFAALKNNGAEISVVYADDSSSAGISVRYVRTTFAYTVANLPAGLRGMRATVVDSTLAAAGNFGQVVTGGGTNEVPVWYDATAAAWKLG